MPRLSYALLLVVWWCPSAYCGRLFAIGDLHGDLHNALRCFQLCNLTDDSGQWTGGDATLVQTGDVVDRGPDSRRLLDLLASMGRQAASAGGQVIQLLGNHEIMAFKGRTKYTNVKELQSFGGPAGRLAAFGENGPYGYLRQLDSVRVLRDNLFVHAGLTMKLSEMGLEGLNKEVRKQVKQAGWNTLVLADHGPSWTRQLIRQAEQGHCDLLLKVLRTASEQLGRTVSRMLVGHTIQHTGKIGVFCNASMIAIDISISSYNKLGADHIAAVELHQQSDGTSVVEVLTPDGRPELTVRGRIQNVAVKVEGSGGDEPQRPKTILEIEESTTTVKKTTTDVHPPSSSKPPSPPPSPVSRRTTNQSLLRWTTYALEFLYCVPCSVMLWLVWVRLRRVRGANALSVKLLAVLAVVTPIALWAVFVRYLVPGRA